MTKSITVSSGILVLALTALLSSCASSGPAETTANLPVRKEMRAASQIDKDSTSSIAQISSQDQKEAAYQISKNQAGASLTIDQLRNYADRCGPENLTDSPPEIDCSALGLRIKRAYKTEDQVVDALITLDRLGRNASAEDVSDDLRDGRADGSANAQAIASGIFEPAPPAPEAPPPPEELEELITNGFIDAIIANTQGR